MEEAVTKIGKNPQKSITLVGRCGKCHRTFEAVAELPIIYFEDLEGNAYRGSAAPHLVTLCPYCFGLLNLALRTETKKRLNHGS